MGGSEATRLRLSDTGVVVSHGPTTIRLTLAISPISEFRINIPHEFPGEIFGHLSPDDRESLQTCSLVAKSWVSPAQRRLLSSLMAAENNHQSWKGGVLYANTNCSDPMSLSLRPRARIGVPVLGNTSLLITSLWPLPPSK